MNVLHIDLETYSATDITAGVYRYSEDPEFRILMAAYSWNRGPVQLAVGEDEIREQVGRQVMDPNVTKVAHNAQFERVCLSRLLRYETGTYLPPEPWRDTMVVAAELGLPQSLDKLAAALGAEDKDTAGTRLINMFCRPGRNGNPVGPADKPEEWERFKAYCVQDVATLLDVDERLPTNTPTATETAVWNTDQRINDYGIAVDRGLVDAGIAAGNDNALAEELELMTLTGVENPRSVQQLRSALGDMLGERIPDLKAETVKRMLARPGLPGPVRRSLELRKSLALSAAKKLTAADTCMSGDGRLRGAFRFYGAHTGRWAGRGVQLQNLPRDQFDSVDEENGAILRLVLEGEASATDLKKLIRAMFVGPFSVVDYSAIEARVISWLAGESWALEAFRAGRDIYVETANRMGPTMTRSHGKVAVLALGFGGGVGSLEAMAPGGIPSADGTRTLNKGEMQGLVNAWRASNRMIVSFWGRLERAFKSGGSVGHLRVDTHGEHRRIVLPSGRALVYREVRQQAGRLSFWDGRGYRTDTYGGRLAENVTQATARDVLAEALVRLHDAGHRVVGHVHDEVLVEGTNVTEVQNLMCTPPDWAAGLPINAEGFTCSRYRKG